MYTNVFIFIELHNSFIFINIINISIHYSSHFIQFIFFIKNLKQSVLIITQKHSFYTVFCGYLANFSISALRATVASYLAW